MSQQERPPSFSIPTTAEPWLSRALGEIQRYIQGQAAGTMISANWRWSEGMEAGQPVVILERRVGKEWVPKMTIHDDGTVTP